MLWRINYCSDIETSSYHSVSNGTVNYLVLLEHLKCIILIKMSVFLLVNTHVHIIIIIKSCWQYGFLCLSLSIRSYDPLLLAGPRNNTQCRHRIDVSSCWSYNAGASQRKGPLKNIAYEIVLASPAVPLMSFSFYFDGFWDGI